VVLMGDAVHTAHFAIGSGTKLALEDAIELTRQFRDLGDTPSTSRGAGALPGAARVDVLRLQNAAWNAMEWFEVCGERYCDQLDGPSSSCTPCSPAASASATRTCACAMRLAGGLRALVCAARRRDVASPARRRTAADVHALHAARPDAEEPRGGVADGAVLCVDGVPATTTWCTWAPARWAARAW
jgi:hypothetical protein